MKNRLFAKAFVCALTLFSGIIISSCSSAPKRPMMETTVYQQAVDRYEAANGQLISFQTEQALSNLQIAQRLACSIDNVELLCKIYLSAVIYRLTAGEVPQANPTAFDGKSAQQLHDTALQFAERSTKAQFLRSVAKVYQQKILQSQGSACQSQEIISAQKDFSSDPFYLAFSYRTLGDVYTQEKNWTKAVEAYQQAASIHTKNRYLVEIGLDWYSLARVYSLSGNKNAAIDSLNTALSFDKAAENSGAIATDYLALAKLLVKDTSSAEDLKKAKNAALWSAEIFESAGFTEEARGAAEYAQTIQ